MLHTKIAFTGKSCFSHLVTVQLGYALLEHGALANRVTDRSVPAFYNFFPFERLNYTDAMDNRMQNPIVQMLKVRKPIL